jgi:hypothetical protein
MAGALRSSTRNQKWPRTRIAVGAAVAAAAMAAVVPAAASAADRKLGDASVNDATRGAGARVELWQRDGDGAVYPKVWVSDTKADGICAHAAVHWLHKNGNTYTDYGSWICGAGTSSKEPSVKGGRNWRDYRTVSIAAFVDNGTPATAHLYDFDARPPWWPGLGDPSPSPAPTEPAEPKAPVIIRDKEDCQAKGRHLNQYRRASFSGVREAIGPGDPDTYPYYPEETLEFVAFDNRPGADRPGDDLQDQARLGNPHTGRGQYKLRRPDS